MRSKVSYLFWLVWCFPVLCLEDCWHVNDV